MPDTAGGAGDEYGEEMSDLVASQRDKCGFGRLSSAGGGGRGRFGDSEGGEEGVGQHR